MRAGKPDYISAIAALPVATALILPLCILPPISRPQPRRTVASRLELTAGMPRDPWRVMVLLLSLFALLSCCVTLIRHDISRILTTLAPAAGGP